MARDCVQGSGGVLAVHRKEERDAITVRPAPALLALDDDAAVWLLCGMTECGLWESGRDYQGFRGNQGRVGQGEEGMSPGYPGDSPQTPHPH